MVVDGGVSGTSGDRTPLASPARTHRADAQELAPPPPRRIYLAARGGGPDRAVEPRWFGTEDGSDGLHATRTYTYDVAGHHALGHALGAGLLVGLGPDTVLLRDAGWCEHDPGSRRRERVIPRTALVGLVDALEIARTALAGASWRIDDIPYARTTGAVLVGDPGDPDAVAIDVTLCPRVIVDLRAAISGGDPYGEHALRALTAPGKRIRSLSVTLFTARDR